MMSERKSSKGPSEARDLMDRLAKDSDYQAMKQAKEEERLRLIEEDRQAELPVLDALRQAGFEVERIGYLEHTGQPYPEAIPILIEWLPRITHEQARRNIVSTLRQKWARREVVPALLEEFRRAEEEGGLRWEIAEAIEYVADKSHYDDVLALVKDPAYGRDRQMLLLVLGRLGDASTASTLVGLLKDKHLLPYALEALGKLKVQETRPAIEPFVNHPDSHVRKQAKTALAKIDRAAAGLRIKE